MNQELKHDPRYKNHESRPDLAGEHPLGDTYQLIAGLLFFGAIAVDYLWLHLGPRINDHVNFWLRISLGSLAALFGGWLALTGIHMVFSEYTEEPRMITHHLFSIIRHPVYLGAILFYIAALIVTLSPLGLLVFPGVLCLYDWLADDEEERMEKIFGEKYRLYKQSVPKWLPRLNSR